MSGRPPDVLEPPTPTHDPSDPGARDPGDAVLPGIPGPGSDGPGGTPTRERDPGDAVPPGTGG